MSTIEIRTRPIVWSGGVEVGAHNYIVYTYEKNGQTVQEVFSAHPDHNGSITAPWGNLKAETGTYNTNSYDWQTSGFQSHVVASGANLSSQWNAIKQCATTINNGNFQYQPLGQNSNAAVAQCLLQAGIDIPDGLTAYTNGLWTPSDSDGLFNNPVHPGFGFGGGGWFQPPAQSPSYFDFGLFPSGRWQYASVEVDGQVNGGWRWVEYGFATRIKPIILDLNGNGLETRAITDGIQHDWNGDGYKQSTGWVGAGDGFLVYDANGNGVVDDGREVALTSFSPGAQSDLEALRAFDSNGDGQFSSADAQFGQFGVWVDGNQNGSYDAGELQSLAAHQIQSIALQGTTSDTWNNMNYVTATTTVTRSNGTTITGYDVGISAAARGSVHLGATTVAANFWNPQTTWQAIEVSTGELVMSNTSNINLVIQADDIAFNGRKAVGIFTGSGNDSISLGNLQTVNGVSTMVPRSEAVMISSGAGNDTIHGNSTANNVIDAGDGADTIHGGDGDDIITFGLGEYNAAYGWWNGDMAWGGAGNDMYRIQRGATNFITDTAGSNDAVVVLDVSRSEVSLARSGQDLHLSLSNGSYLAIITNYFQQGWEVESISFRDGEILSAPTIASMGGYGSNSAMTVADNDMESIHFDYPVNDNYDYLYDERVVQNEYHIA